MESSLWVPLYTVLCESPIPRTGNCGKVTYLRTTTWEVGAKSGKLLKGNWEPFGGATQWKRAFNKTNVKFPLICDKWHKWLHLNVLGLQFSPENLYTCFKNPSKNIPLKETFFFLLYSNSDSVSLMALQNPTWLTFLVQVHLTKIHQWASSYELQSVSLC